MPDCSHQAKFLDRLILWVICLGFDRWKLVSTLVLIFAAVSPFLISGIRIETTSSGSSLPNDPVSRNYTSNLRRFGDSELLIIYLEYGAEDVETANQLTDGLARELASWPDILYIETQPFDLKDRETASRLLRAALLSSEPDLRRRFAARFDEPGMRRELRKTRKKLATVSDPSLRELLVADVLNMRDLFQPYFETRMGNFEFSYLTGYYDSTDGAARLLFVQPEGFSEDADFCAGFIDRVDRAIIEAKDLVPNAHAIQHQLTGKYAVIGESMQILKQDMKRITLIASVLIFLLLFFAFRNIRAVLISFIPLSISILAVLVMARLVFNPLNFMALGFVAIIIGLGVDVTLHLTGRLYQLLEETSSPRAAVIRALTDSTPPVAIGLSTTALVFLCLIFAEYRALLQFGLLTSIGLLVILCMNLLLFPTAVRIFGPRTGGKIKAVRFRRFPKPLVSLLLDRPVFIIGIAVIVGSTGIFCLKQFNFDMDFFVAFPRRLKTLDTIGQVSSRFGAAPFLNTQITIEANDFPAALAAQKILDEKLLGFVQEGRIDGFQSSSLFLPHSERDDDRSDFQDIESIIDKNRGLFLELLDEHKFKITQEYGSYYDLLRSAVDLGEETLPVRAWDWKAFPRLQKFAAEENGKVFLLTNVWPNRSTGNEFAEDHKVFEELQQLSRNVETGFQVTGAYQVFEKVGEVVRKDFFKISLIGLLAVLVFISLFFRSAADVLLCLLPLGGAVSLTLVFVVLAGIPFSPFQIGITAMLIGIGIDDSVHLLARTRLGKKRNIYDVLPEIGPVLTMTTLSTLIGFGALIFSRNRAVSSMGFVIAFGVFSCFLFTLLLIPPILRILEKKR